MSDEAEADTAVIDTPPVLPPWQPHWVETAQQMVAGYGWHLREHPGDVLHVTSADHVHSVPVDLTAANEYARIGANATADETALRAINEAMEKLHGQQAALNAAREAVAAKFKPRSLKQRLLDRIA